MNIRPRIAQPYSLTRLLALCMAAGLLAGCDYLGIESSAQVAAEKVAEGKALGGACRHASRALEDCYAYNPKANKSAIFEGWKEMDAYMRENSIESVKPVTTPNLGKKEEAAKKPKPDHEDETEEVVDSGKGGKNGKSEAKKKDH